MTLNHLRRYFFTAHLLMGFVFGGAFALLGVTGSFLVFYPEIDRLLNPELVNPRRMLRAVAVQTFFDQLHTRFPNRKGAWRIELPRSTDQVVFARYLKPEETDPKTFAPLVVAMDPQTGEILNARRWGSYAVTWVYDLHYSFLMGPEGKMLVSVLGLALWISVCLGVVLWLPKGSRIWVKAIPKVRSGHIKATYDIHGYLGAYGAVLLCVMGVTGVGLATPQWVEPVVNVFSAREDKPTVYSAVPLPGTQRITADEAVRAGLAMFPHASLRWIEAPVHVADTYVLRFQQPTEPSQRFPKTFVWVDQFSGDVLASRDALRVNAGDAIFDWLHPLHNGEAFGWTGRLLALVAGALPLVLLITGSLRWWQKRRAKQMAAQRLTRHRPYLD